MANLLRALLVWKFRGQAFQFPGALLPTQLHSWRIIFLQQTFQEGFQKLLKQRIYPEPTSIRTLTRAQLLYVFTFQQRTMLEAHQTSPLLKLFAAPC